MSSIHALRGTAAHWVLEQCLIRTYTWGLPTRADEFIGEQVLVVTGEPHATHSPSSAKRWMACPASIRMAEDFPEKEEAGEHGIEFTDEDARAVQVCLTYVADRVRALESTDDAGANVSSERKVYLEPWFGTNDMNGTSDVVITSGPRGQPPMHAEHIDYKHGAGVPVPADDPQNALYFLGVCAEYATRHTDINSSVKAVPFKTAALTIVQPRCDKMEPRIRTLNISDVPAWLAVQLVKVNEAYYATMGNSPGFRPGKDACRFCSVGGGAKYSGHPVCEAYTGYCMKSMGIPQDASFEDAVAVTVQPPSTLTQERIRVLLDTREMITGMLSSVEAHAQELMEKATATSVISDLYKLVRRKTNRAFFSNDNAVVLKALKKIRGTDPTTGKARALGKKDLYTEKLGSPAAIEKKLKGLVLTDSAYAAFKAMIVKPEGGLTIAPRTDPRDEVVPFKESADTVLANVPPATPLPGTPAK